MTPYQERAACTRALRVAGACLTMVAGLCGPTLAHALPSFAQQTGLPCASCHVGSFGPQLTPFGRSFKLQGYTLSNHGDRHVPIAAMLVATYTHTRADQPESAGPHAGTNDNASLQEASVFLAGRIAEHLGAFVQTTYSDIDRLATLDNMDVRWAQSLTLARRPAVVGVSVNNNPTVQDVWNTLPAWRFPYVASELVPETASAPLLEGGLEHQVIGATAYAYFDNAWYAEFGGYRSLSRGFLRTVNVEDAAGRLAGAAPYWRIAYTGDGAQRSWSVGAFGLSADLHPNRIQGPTDRYRDAGLDASYQWLLDAGVHVFSANAAYLRERQSLAATLAAGGAAQARATLRSLSWNVSYYYDRHYGVTLGRFGIHGTRDMVRFAPEPGSGSRTGNPDSTGTILQGDWTPFGQSDSWHTPWVNLRIGLQYTRYDRFNGASRNYDGFGRSARDNDTLFLFFWTAL